ncbi:ATP-binding protein [Turicibacter sanguinis]|uniref:ATP-binding protein n=1 Tax=Turicibacter sanguinis TaxID=154288 RepID=UPI00325A616E
MWPIFILAFISELLFQVISERSERGSVIITTNLEFSKWTELFENEIMVSALIDRVTFRSHILDMNVSESYRFKETKKRLQQENKNN